ncbi:MAG: hypothetical protein HC862_21975 [Scytonema sp. RU_4_4]|jgi:phage FluMu gp28-like protein|nr:hypothetical protein [Scytonema sp. RU_4_4]
MKWLEPWCSIDNHDAQFHQSFRKQLEREVAPGHVMYGLPARLIARGNGDDALFKIEDGSDRVAEVHLTWAKGQETLPRPRTVIYSSLEAWAEQSMRPEHEEWKAE